MPRCQKCFGYLNMYCMFDSKSWRCPLCQYRNYYDKNSLGGRYLSSIERSRCPECVFPNIILESNLSDVEYSSEDFFMSRKEYPYNSKAREILALVIDCTPCNDFLQFIKSVFHSLISLYHGEADISISFSMFPI